MNFARAAGLLMMVAAGIGIMLMLGQGIAKQGTGGSGGELVIGFQSVEPIEFQGEPVVRFRVNATGEGSALIRVKTAEKEFPKKVIWLGGAGASSGKSPLMREKLEKMLKVAGVPVVQGTVHASGKTGKYYVVATGAWPEELLGKLDSVVKKEDVLIYFGVMDGSVVGRDGQVYGAEEWPSWMNSTTKAPITDAWEIQVPDGGIIWAVRKTPDEAVQSTKLLEEVANAILESPQIEPLDYGTFEISKGGHTFILKGGKEVWARAYVQQEGKISKVIDFGPLELSMGRIIGPAEVEREGTARYQVRLNLQLPQKENLKYYVVALDDNGKEIGRKKIGEGGTKERWIGAFEWEKWPTQGDARLLVQDQYGRVWAKALIHLPKWEIVSQGDFGVERSYLLLKDGKVPKVEKVVVWKKGGNSTQELPVVEGVVRVSSHYEKGRQELYFQIGNSVVSYSWEEREGLVEFYLKYGLGAVLFAALAYIIARSARKSKYIIRVPSAGRRKARKLVVGWDRFLEVFDAVAKKRKKKSPLSASEIQKEIVDGNALGSGIVVGEENVKELLEKGVKGGKIRAWQGFYFPSKWHGSKNIRLLALSRRIEEWMIIKGIVPRKAGKFAWKLPGGVGRISIWEKEKKIKAVSMQGTIVFAGDDEKEEFMGMAKKSGREWSRIWLLLHSGKLGLKTIDELEKQ